MAIDACIAAIRQRLAGQDNRQVTDDEAAQLMQEVQDRHARRQADGTGGSFEDAARDLAQEEAAAAAIKKRNALMNLLTRVNRTARLEEKAFAVGKDGQPDFGLALQSEIHGINTPTRGGRFSARGQWSTQSEKYIGGLIEDLERAGVYQLLRNGTLDREWVRELAELNKGDQGRPGISGSPQAKTAAEILHKWTSLAKQDMNKRGAWIGDYFGYVTRTSHDADLIRRAGFNSWYAAITPLLDEAKTFEGVADPVAFMRGVYSALYTGIHLTQEGLVGMKDPAFTGGSNFARRASEGRVLHFRDADAWFDYNSQFGSHGPLETIVFSLERAARDGALMERWGTNPRAEFEADIRRLSEKHRNAYPDAVVALQNARPELDNRFAFLDGRANLPVDSLGARVLATMRTIETMGKLGNVAWTHMTTAATKGAALRRNGVGLFEAYADFFQSLGRNRGATGSQVREVMDLLKAGVAGRQQTLLDRVQADDSLPGTVSRLAGTFMKATGLTYMLNAERAGTEFTLARFLGRYIDQGWDALPVETRRELLKHDIGALEWDHLRSADNHPYSEGQRFLTPDAAYRLNGDVIEGHLRARAAEAEADAQARAARVTEAQAALDAATGGTPAPAAGMTRMYHGGADQTIDGLPRWFSSQLDYARSYSSDGTVSYVDIPTDHPLIAPEYPEQSIARGFHRNLNLPAEFADRRQLLREGGGDGAAERRALEAAKRDAARGEALRGLQHLGPEASPERVDRMVGDYRERLAMRLHAYYRDAADQAIVTPDIPERSFWYGGTRPGTFKGEFWRSVSQFKMWPTAVIRQQIGAEVYGGQTAAAATIGLMQLAVGATVLGYMRMAAVDMMGGKNPRAPNDPRTWVAAMAQGGGFGILGDYLFHDYSRFGHNLSESLLGPVLGGGLGDVVNIWNTIKAGAVGSEAERETARKQIGPEVFRMTMGHVPFVNLFYTRLALQYLFVWDLQEYMSPGYLARYQKTMQRNTGQTYWLNPSQERMRPFTGGG